MPSSSPFRAAPRAVAVLVLFAALLTARPLLAQTTFNVGNEAQLRTAIASLDNGDTITLTNDITLTGDLDAFQVDGVTLNGAGHTLSGASQYRGLFIGAPNGGSFDPVTMYVHDLTIKDTVARGGNGGTGDEGGGGGAGMGGAIFVAASADVHVNNVSVQNSAAVGGAGADGVAGVGASGGGGGLGGNGGSAVPAGSGTGGGGGGGGVGRGASGGSSNSAGSTGIITYATSGGSAPGGFGGAAAGGGGGGNNEGRTTGGGGGGDAAGSSDSASGASGGFGGGGGGRGTFPPSSDSFAGSGGYGGGGGGGISGSGGFGGGAGGDGTGASAAGFGGGSANLTNGGGGAGMGGAVFVQGGGHISIDGAFRITGSAAAGGAGGTGAGSGSGYGAGMFLDGSGLLDFTPASGQTVQIDDAITDTPGAAGAFSDLFWSLRQSGAGRTILRGTNLYWGQTYITDGVLNVASDANLGRGNLLIQNAMLEVMGTGAFNRTLLLTGNGTVSVGAGQTATWNGPVGDYDSPGRLIVRGGGTLALTSDENSYGSGSFVFENSTLAVTSDQTLGASGTGIFLGDASSTGTLRLLNSFNTNRPITLGAGGGIVDVTAGNSALLTGAIANGTPTPSPFTKAGAGDLTLGTANTYSGATTVAGGTLRAGAVGAFGSSSVMTVKGGATLDLNGYDQTFDTTSGDGNIALGSATLTTGGVSDAALNGAISGTGRLVKNGTGTLTLGGPNTYSGGTTVNTGTLVGTTTSLQGAIVDNAAVVFDQQTTGAFNGTLSGSGSLLKSGAGAVTLANGNSYGGPTTIAGGVLRAGAAGAFGTSGAMTINAGATLDLNGFDASFTTISGDGGVALGSATLTTANGSNTAIGGPISGTGRLVKNGAGTLTLGGANSYSGGTTVNGGNLVGTTSSLVGNIVDNANVTFDQNGNGIYGGNISGSGSVTKAGSGIVTLTGTSTYQGGTFINGGALIGSSANLRGNIALNGGQVQFEQGTDGVLQGTLTGSGGSIKRGVGRLTLNGANTMAGLLDIQQGALTLNGSLGGPAAVRSGAAFALNGSVGGAVTVDQGATFSSVGSVGSLTVGGIWTLPSLGSQASSLTSGPNFLTSVQALNATDPATLTVNGNLTMTPGSVLNIDATEGPKAPVQVTGSASFTGTQFNINVRDISTARLASYPLVSANSLTLSNATASTQLPSFLVPSLYTSANTLRVSVLNLLVPIAAVPTTPNGRAVGGAVDSLKPGTGPWGPFLRNLAGLEDDQLKDALDQLSGEVNVTNVKMAVMDSEAITDIIRDEMSRRDDDDGDGSGKGRVATRSLAPRWWTELTGAHSRLRGQDGLHGATVDVGGLAGGFDIRRTDSFTFGAGLSFTAGGLSLEGLKEASHLKAPRGFGYAGVRLGPFLFHGGGSVAKTQMSSDRQIQIQAARSGDTQPAGTAFDQTAEADRDGTAQDAWSEWQDTFRRGEWTTESKVGWRHARFARNPFTESGGGPVSLVGGDDLLTLTESDVVIRSFKRSGSYRPHFMFTYRREFGDSENSANAQFVDQPSTRFEVTGLPLAKNTIIGRSGLTVRTGSGLEYTVEYEFRHADFETRHSGDFRIRFR